MNRLVFLLTLLILPAAAAAQGEGGLAGPFLRMGLGARAIAMGGAQTAIADDGYAAFYNPGGLPFLNKRHFSTTYSLLSLDRRIQYISYSQRLEPLAGLSLFWLRAGTDNIDGRDLSGNHTFDLSESMNVFGLSFANRFHDKVSVGLTIKVIKQSLDLVSNELSADDLLFDIGIMLIPLKDLKIGVQFKDLNGGLSWDTQDIFSRGTISVDSIPYIINVGASYIIRFPVVSTLKLIMRFNRNSAVKVELICSAGSLSFR